MARQLAKHAKLTVSWRTNQYDYSVSAEKDIIEKLAAKYGVDKKDIKVIPTFVANDETGKEISIKDDVIGDIQNPHFQQSLFAEYLKLNKVDGVELEDIYKIDNFINGNIDFNAFDKYKSYKIKWVKWDNFLSYGENNTFSFENSDGIILLNGQPANQCGKTTFAIDLIHFVFFGKTTKTDKQEEIFNIYLPEATKVVAEMCIEIDGENFVIKRTLSRPALAKRTEKSKTTSSVEYYKLVGEERIELSEYDKAENYTDETVAKTNKLIQEATGQESDFDLIVCATSSNLDDLIDKSSTEKGVLLTRWIGLESLEKKDKITREYYNAHIKNSPYAAYSVDELQRTITQLSEGIEGYKEANKGIEKTVKQLEKDKAEVEKQIAALESIDYDIPAELKGLNKPTLEQTREYLKSELLKLKARGDELDKDYKALGDVEYDMVAHENLKMRIEGLRKEIMAIDVDNNHRLREVEALTKGEFCPTCGRRFDNVDNSKTINELKTTVNNETARKVGIERELDGLNAQLGVFDQARIARDEKGKKAALIEAVKEKFANFKTQYQVNEANLAKYDQYSANIAKKEENEQQRLVLVETKNQYQRQIAEQNSIIANNNAQVLYNEKEIKRNEDIIVKVNEHEKTIRNWKVYMDIVGKNGISKMILKKALPIINANLMKMLDGVTDFDVALTMNDKNEVVFNIYRDNTVANLKSGSGFELTAAALALRTVLADMSTLPKPNYCVLDEVMTRVAKENLDKMRLVIEKMRDSYDTIFIVSHMDEIKEWANKIVSVTKTNNVSRMGLM